MFKDKVYKIYSVTNLVIDDDEYIIDVYDYTLEHDYKGSNSFREEQEPKVKEYSISSFEIEPKDKDNLDMFKLKTGDNISLDFTWETEDGKIKVKDTTKIKKITKSRSGTDVKFFIEKIYVKWQETI